MGIAAPQIGIDRAAAIVRTPDGESITLFNPTIIETAGDTDEQYEGCLSFFDVRGQVPRPHIIHVEHTTIDGTTKITVFERGIARLVAHEVDTCTARSTPTACARTYSPSPSSSTEEPGPAGHTADTSSGRRTDLRGATPPEVRLGDPHPVPEAGAEPAFAGTCACRGRDPRSR
ncbi:peptide deformylase [Amycolatopsis sp. DG1A-15b]|uniref:peptide deformylase n=1 Tax=Amycolatopsis sp. DG1A-15b TaxID=3052846 RepID=UPI00255B5A85|nr:peptide deformylase [Amycolatopsis sp. DG1A-15b]WIX91350.1 peptide deformylase [Amycolatopsis sp. DG1A-15b]